MIPTTFDSQRWIKSLEPEFDLNVIEALFNCIIKQESYPPFSVEVRRTIEDQQLYIRWEYFSETLILLNEQERKQLVKDLEVEFCEGENIKKWLKNKKTKN